MNDDLKYEELLALLREIREIVGAPAKTWLTPEVTEVDQHSTSGDTQPLGDLCDDDLQPRLPESLGPLGEKAADLIRPPRMTVSPCF
jgi:hypothetical protein